MVSLINKQLLLTAYAYLFIMEQQEAQQGSKALQVEKAKQPLQKGEAKPSLQKGEAEPFVQLPQKWVRPALYKPSTPNGGAPQQYHTANKDEGVKQGQTSPPATGGFVVTVNPFDPPAESGSPQPSMYAQKCAESSGEKKKLLVDNPFGPPAESMCGVNGAVSDPGKPGSPQHKQMSGSPAKFGFPQQIPKFTDVVAERDRELILQEQKQHFLWQVAKRTNEGKR